MAEVIIGKVRLGGMEYTIKEVPVISRVDFELGHIGYLEQVITLDNAMQPDKKRFALMHECIHGILTEAGYNSETNDEKLVNAITWGVIEVIDQRVPLLMDREETVETLYRGIDIGVQHKGTGA